VALRLTTATVTNPDELETVLFQALVTPNRRAADRTEGWRGPVFAVPPLRGDEVPRPDLMAELVAAVTQPGTSAVGMTTGLWGAGGFGKTTMARLLVHRQDVRLKFPDGVVWVIVGEDISGPELAEKVTNAVALLSGERPGLTDPLAAGAQLGRVLGQRQVLLVVDDVWKTAQVEPFLMGGPGAVRLFTTRIRGVLPDSVQPVVVDEMDRSEAVQLLTTGVGGVSAGVVAGLLAATGRWPVLLGLVNAAVRGDLRAGRPAEESMREILRELRTTGPTALDVTDADERHTAVARTIGVSLSRLTDQQRARYLELAVFGEDVTIPGPVLVRYWKATGGWSEFQTGRFCQRLAELALLSDYRRDPDQVGLHDVIHAYLREQTHHRRSELHRALLDAHRGLVQEENKTSAWWQLPAAESYLWTWLPTHLHGAERDHELRACLHHPGWLVGKLENVGQAGLAADLALSDDSLSRALGIAVRQNAHLLAPMHPPGSLAATLATRLPDDGPTKAIADRLVAGMTMPHLRAITPLPDLPHLTQDRAPTGHTRRVSALVVAPDGSWLASADTGGEIQLRDPVTGTAGHTLTGHTHGVARLVVAPDGSWLASAEASGEVRMWDLATGTTRYTLTGHHGGVSELVVAPDGSWLAVAAGQDNQIRIWDAASGATRHILTGHRGGVWALAVAPDGSWLASAGEDGELRIWDPAAGTSRYVLTGHLDWLRALVVAPDGSWLACAGHGGQVRVWDPVTGAARHTLIGHHGDVWTLVASPDGSWLASAGEDGEVRIWDPATGAARHLLVGHSGGVWALAVAPDGSWLASAGYGGEVRVWDLATGSAWRLLVGHSGGVWALVVAPDGSWLASADTGGEVRAWNPMTGAARHILIRHTSGVEALTAASDGSWLASAGHDRQVRIWNPVTGTTRHILTGHTRGVEALVGAPDGTWLASADTDGEMRIWDPVTGATRHILTGGEVQIGDPATGTTRGAVTGRTRAVTALAVAPDGSWLASADTGGKVRIWDPASGATCHTLTGHTRAVTALAVAPDGSWLASTGHDRQVRIWDPATGTTRHTLTGHTRAVTALAVAPDGSWLASAGYGGEVRMWDPVIGSARYILTGHTHTVWALAVAPDQSWLASAGEDGELRIWDPVTGTTRHTLTGPFDWQRALVVAPDGSWLASAGTGGEVRIWNATTAAPLTSLRVAGSLLHLALASTTIAAAGEYGPYFLTLCSGIESEQIPSPK
jgi:WD40 repeat protein